MPRAPFEAGFERSTWRAARLVEAERHRAPRLQDLSLKVVRGDICAVLSCLACLTPVAVLAMGAIGLGAWTARLDAVLLLLAVGFVALIVYRYWTVLRTTP